MCLICSLRARSRSSPHRPLPTKFEIRLEIPKLVPGVHLELNPLRSVEIDQELAVAQHADDQIDRCTVEHDELIGKAEGAFEIALQIEVQAGPSGFARCEPGEQQEQLIGEAAEGGKAMVPIEPDGRIVFGIDHECVDGDFGAHGPRRGIPQEAGSDLPSAASAAAGRQRSLWLVLR